jgi:hypothetical protein
MIHANGVGLTHLLCSNAQSDNHAIHYGVTQLTSVFWPCQLVTPRSLLLWLKKKALFNISVFWAFFLKKSPLPNW